MDTLSYKGFEGTAEIDMSSLMCRGKILFIDDLVTYKADTPAELQREFEAAVEDYLETCALVGKDPQKPCKGLFNVRVPPPMHKAAVLRAMEDGVTLNDVVVKSMDAYLFASPQQVTNHTYLTVQIPASEYRTLSGVGSQMTHWETESVH